MNVPLMTRQWMLSPTAYSSRSVNGQLRPLTVMISLRAVVSQSSA